ncbi:hypothetical protein ACVWWD_006173 [Mesorhizobium sp. URHB0026]
MKNTARSGCRFRQLGLAGSYILGLTPRHLDANLPRQHPRLATWSMLLEQGLDNGNLIVALAALDGIEAAEREIERQPARDKERLSAVLRHDTDGGNVNRPDSAG